MNIIAFNGSARGSKGNTAIALNMVRTNLEKENIQVEIVHLSEKKLSPCMACFACKGKNECVQDDDINGLYQRMLAADGIILASPTYFANVTSRMQMLVERCGIMARTNGNSLKGKVGASIAVARRAGQNNVYSALNYFFGIANMPIATSTYWNNMIGGEPGEVTKDGEGSQTMNDLAATISMMLRKLRA